MGGVPIAYSRLAYLQRYAHALRHGLSERLDEIYVSDFPTSGPREVIKLIQKILERTVAVIDGAKDERAIVLTSLMIQNLGSTLHIFDNAHTEQTPRGLVQLIDALTKGINPNELLLVWPQADYNYTITNIVGRLRELLENSLPHGVGDELLKPFLGPISIVSFPRIARDNILMHAIFGHEIGHPIADAFLTGERASTAYSNQLLSAQSQIAALPSTATNPIEKLRQQQRWLQTVLNLRERALEELISDYVGLLLFGPSAMFAFQNLFMVANWDELPSHDEYYPPPRYRMRLMRNHLEKAQYITCLRKLRRISAITPAIDAALALIAELDGRVAVTTDTDQIEAQPLIRIAYEWVSSSLAPACDYAKSRLGTAYSADLAEKQIPELLSRLSLGIPPNEIGRAESNSVADCRSAVLAGWFQQIFGQKEENGAFKPFDSKQAGEVERLTLRAIEYIVLQNRYQAKVATMDTAGAAR